MKLLVCFILGLIAVPIGLKAQAKFLKITNELYSISVPVNWELMEGSPRNGKLLGKRSTEEYNIFYWGWRMPFETMEDIRIALDIQSYQRKKSSSLVEGDIEKMELNKLEGMKVEHLIYTKTIPKYDQIRFSLVKTASEHDGTIVAYRRFYMIQRNKSIVHRLMISMPEVQYQKEKSYILKTIESILNSFRSKT